MATVDVSFTPLPAHVRTARLVATAVARRSGVPDSLLDEVRLAVGEACSRAVEAHQEHCPAVPVHIRLTRDDDRFEVTVIDAGSPDSGSPGGGSPGGVPSAGDPGADVAANGQSAANGAAAHNGHSDTADMQLPSAMGLAVIAGLADDVSITRTDEGLAIQMSWTCHTPADTVSR
jgi:serine/threonine-protein kinase RsbW